MTLVALLTTFAVVDSINVKYRWWCGCIGMCHKSSSIGIISVVDAINVQYVPPHHHRHRHHCSCCRFPITRDVHVAFVVNIDLHASFCLLLLLLLLLSLAYFIRVQSNELRQIIRFAFAHAAHHYEVYAIIAPGQEEYAHDELCRYWSHAAILYTVGEGVDMIMVL